MFRGGAQERDHVGGAAERVGDGPAVDQRDGGPPRFVDFGPEGRANRGWASSNMARGSSTANQCRASAMLG
jgi:hypothetical protein